MDLLSDLALRVARVRPAEVVRVPVATILYLQPMAEHGSNDRPRSLGPALPCDQVCYRQD